MKLNELSEEVKRHALESYLDNEVGSDQYRDTQPGNGLEVASMYHFSNMTSIRGEGGLKEADLDMLKAIIHWLSEIVRETEDPDPEGRTWKAYAGCDALEPVLVKAFNSMWELNVHPYGYDAAQVLADFDEWSYAHSPVGTDATGTLISVGDKVAHLTFKWEGTVIGKEAAEMEKDGTYLLSVAYDLESDAAAIDSAVDPAQLIVLD
jgi:hypothetical protein